MIQLPNYEEREEFKKAQRSKILAAFKRETEGSAHLITKAEFIEKFPTEKYEIYTLKAVDNFRQEIIKAEGVEDKELAFKKATEGLKHFVVTEGDNKNIVFVREKEKGE